METAMGHPARKPPVERLFEEIAAAPARENWEPTIDLVHLSRQTLGDGSLETELLTLFDTQAHAFAARLGQPMRPGENKWRADLAHTLNGSARAIGAHDVGRAAQAYEDAARAGDADLSLRLARLDAAIGAARRAIAELLGRA